MRVYFTNIMKRKIAVISDTHNRLPEHVVVALASADEIWHLGDVCSEATLDPLIALGIPLVVIRGNNDFQFDWPLEKRFQFGDKRFLLIHIPPHQVSDTDVVLSGHTHLPRNEIVNEVRWLNPGSVGLPNKGKPAAWAWMELETETGEFTWASVPV